MTPDTLYSLLQDNSNKYLLVKDFFNEQDLQDCIKLAMSCESEPDDGGYKAFLFDPVKEFGEQHILSQIDVEKVAKCYGFQTLDDYFWEVAMDSETFDNDFHTDVKFSKNYVTLQWYLHMDDLSRCLYISDTKAKKVTDGQALETVPNTLLSFKAAKNTFHGFEAGKGLRLNIRLRLWEDLVNCNRVHNYNNQDDVCWLIDTKDMEVEDYPTDEWFEDLEGRLANTTYFNLINLKQHNILATREMKKYPQHLARLKNMGFKRCVVVMAGVVVTEDTIDIVRRPMDSVIHGHINGDHLYRGITLLDLENFDVTLAEGYDPYFGNHIDVCKNVHTHEFEAWYIHPESETGVALWRMCESHFDEARKDKKLIDEDYKEDLISACDYLEDFLSKMDAIRVNTVTKDLQNEN